MSKGLFRIGFLGLPAAALTMAIVAACSSDDETATTPDGTDAARDSAIVQQDGSVIGVDSSTLQDAATADSADAAPAPPRLCALYPDTPADASAAEGPRRLYELIAVRALLQAVDSCEIGAVYADEFGDVDLESAPPNPSQITCLGRQLASLAGCFVGGAPLDYNIVNDENGSRCVPTGDASDTIQLGFRNPKTGVTLPYTVKDVDFFIQLTKNAALSTGMTAADAARLEALLQARKSSAATTTGDAGNYSQSSCP